MKFIRKYKGYILAFLIPLIIYFLFFLWKGVFTGKSILNSDMQFQYQTFFQYLKNVLHGEATFPYTFSKGVGGAMYGALFYYFANPMNLLVYFFEDISLFFTFLILLKLSLSGLTMYTFLDHKFKGAKYLLIFSLAYALMGYNIVYSSNIMWLDGVILAPIILLGIDRVIEKKKDGIYLVSIFLAIFLNYYIGYMLVLFSVIYFMYSFVLKYEKNWKQERKQIYHFLFITVLIGFVTSFILIPSGLELLNVSRTSLSKANKWVNLKFLDFIAPTYLGFGSLSNNLNYYGFLVFVGTIMIPLIICYFCNKKISKFEKKLTTLVYVLFLLPVLFPFLNRVWHLFTLPYCFNYRYSFLVSLFSILIMIRSLKELEISKKALIIYYAAYIIFSFSLAYTTFISPDYFLYITISKILVTLIFLGINIYFLIKKKIIIIVWILVLELLVNLTWIGIDSNMQLRSIHQNNKELTVHFSEICVENKRCELVANYTMNDALLGNYKGLTNFISTMNGNVISFFSKVSNYSNERNYYAYRVDIVLDMLLGIEKIGTKDTILDYELVKQIEFNGRPLYFYHNPYALELAYLVSPKIKDFSSSKEGFFFEEDLLNAMNDNKEEYFYKLPLDKIGEKEYRLEKDRQYSYLYLYGSKVDKINGKPIQKILLSANTYGMILDEYGDTITFTLEEETNDFEVYVLDIAKIKEFKENRTQLIIDENSGNKIVGHIEVQEPSTLFTTIPYEKGWEVFVDGKKVNSYEVIDTFLAIDIEEGVHTITFEYHVHGLKMGIFISIISLFLLCGYEYRYQKSTTHD